MICNDCIHHDVCDMTRSECEYYGDFFKDKSLFVELPCKVGDEVYVPVDVGERFKEAGLPWKDYIGQIIPMPATIQHITILYNDKLYSLFESGNILQFKETDIGNKFFITKVAAEKALQERENG